MSSIRYAPTSAVDMDATAFEPKKSSTQRGMYGNSDTKPPNGRVSAAKKTALGPAKVRSEIHRKAEGVNLVRNVLV